MIRAIDASNFTDPLTPAKVEALKSAGVGLIICQAVNPPAGYPPTVTRQQIQTCLDAGLPVDAYVYLWFSLGIEDIRRKLTLLEGFPIRRVWLDLEDVDSAARPSERVQLVHDAMDVLKAFPARLGPGLYSAAWYWPYMGNTTDFAEYPLWAAQYDGIADASVFKPFGGWQSCAIKQWAGTSSLAGVNGIDLDVLSAAEAATLEETDVLVPDDYVTKFSLKDNRDVQGLIDNFEGVISTVRQQAAAEDVDCQTRLQKVRDAVGA